MSPVLPSPTLTTPLPKLVWAFRILATLNALLLAVAFLYQSPGEDAAGAGLRLWYAIVYAIALSAVLLVHRFVRIRWVQVIMLALLASPFLLILYGVARSA
jgi:hypothetical protein